jgi:hypothetical protein
VACRNDHVARPRASTSGGQWAGSVAGGSGDRKLVLDARAAIISAVDFLRGVLLPDNVVLGNNCYLDDNWAGQGNTSCAAVRSEATDTASLNQ